MREFKVVVLGPGGVGKSALTVQFISGKFVERYDPTVEDFYRKEIEVDGDPAYLEILDTAGTEQFASMRDLYIKNGQGFLIVYSLTSRQSFQDVKLIREQIIRVKGNDMVPIVLAANKCDISEMQREVTTMEGFDLATQWRIPYIETSAKNSAIVNTLFTEIVKEMNFKSNLFSGNHKKKNKNKDSNNNVSKKNRKKELEQTKNNKKSKIISPDQQVIPVITGGQLPIINNKTNLSNHSSSLSNESQGPAGKFKKCNKNVKTGGDGCSCWPKTSCVLPMNSQSPSKFCCFGNCFGRSRPNKSSSSNTINNSFNSNEYNVNVTTNHMMPNHHHYHQNTNLDHHHNNNNLDRQKRNKFCSIL